MESPKLETGDQEIITARRNRLQDLPKWSEDVTEYSEDTKSSSSGGVRALVCRTSSSSFCTFQWFRRTPHWHALPEGPELQFCRRNKITRAPCGKRANNHIHRAEKFGDLITADHKIINEEGESRNNHPYAIVVQDLATQWIQSYPCKTKTSPETVRISQKCLHPAASPKVIYTVTHLSLAKLVLTSAGITVRPHRIAPRRTVLQNVYVVCRVLKKAPLPSSCSAVLMIIGGRFL